MKFKKWCNCMHAFKEPFQMECLHSLLRLLRLMPSSSALSITRQEKKRCFNATNYWVLFIWNCCLQLWVNAGMLPRIVATRQSKHSATEAILSFISFLFFLQKTINFTTHFCLFIKKISFKISSQNKFVNIFPKLQNNQF